MSRGLSRRGFARAAGIGVAALWLPSLAFATPPVVLVPRWQHARRGLDVQLHVRSADGASVELLAYAIQLTAELRAGESRQVVGLESQGLAGQRISRAGMRLGRRMVVPAGGEAHYDTFRAPWPEGFVRRGTLVLSTALRYATIDDEQATRLQSLVGLTLEVAVARPA